MNKKDVVTSLHDRYKHFVSKKEITQVVEEKLLLGLSFATILVGTHFYLTERFLNKDITIKKMQKICKCKSKGELRLVLDAVADELDFILSPRNFFLY